MATIKTTRKPTMLKALDNAKTRDEIMALAVEYWNELALGYFIEHEELVYDKERALYCEVENRDRTYSDVSDIYGEELYWLSCYYESGNLRHDEEHHDRHAFLKFAEVFRPYVGSLEGYLSGIPRKEENAFLFN